MSFHRHRKNILKVIHKLDHQQLVVKRFPSDVHKHMRMLKYFERIYCITRTATVIHYCLIPFAHQQYGYIFGITTTWEPLIALNLPFDQLRPVVYEIVDVMEVWNVVFVSSVGVSTDLLFVSIMQILAMEFEALKEKI